MNKTPQQLVSEGSMQILRGVTEWEHGYQSSASIDALESKRKEILNFKANLKNLCAKHNLDLPAEYYIPSPPLVGKNNFHTWNVGFES